MVGGSGVCYVYVCSICVCMVVGPFVWHGVGQGKGGGGLAGLVAVKLQCVNCLL